MDDDPADLARVLETNALPGAARIGALVDAVAERGGLAAHGVLTGAHVDDVRVVRGNGDRADAAHAEAAIRDVAPVRAGVVGLPHASAGVAGIVDERLA